MKVVVMGGGGLIGKKLVARLHERGHETVAASPSSGVNAVTGQGLAQAEIPRQSRYLTMQAERRLSRWLLLRSLSTSQTHRRSRMRPYWSSSRSHPGTCLRRNPAPV